MPVEITNFLYDLVPKIIRLLADARLPLDPSVGEIKGNRAGNRLPLKSNYSALR